MGAGSAGSGASGRCEATTDSANEKNKAARAGSTHFVSTARRMGGFGKFPVQTLAEAVEMNTDAGLVLAGKRHGHREKAAGKPEDLPAAHGLFHALLLQGTGGLDVSARLAGGSETKL